MANSSDLERIEEEIANLPPIDEDPDQQAALDYIISEIEAATEKQTVAAEGGEIIEQEFVEESLPVDVTTDSMRPFYVIPTPRKIALAQLFSQRSNLRGTQFAMNSWGFPPIPFPQTHSSTLLSRLAPSNVERSYLGHPIYWIDSELTKIREGESNDIWSIRMFYLILGFGLWSEPDNAADWVDYPLSRGFRALAADYETYHQIGSPPSGFDSVALLNQDDLLISLEEIEAIYESTVVSISESMKFESIRYSELQVESLRMAKELLGHPIDKDLPFDIPIEGSLLKNVWNDGLKPSLIKALDFYTESRAHPLSSSRVDEMVRNLALATEEITVTLMGIDYIIATISIPSSGAIMSHQSYANWVSLLNLTFHENSSRVSFYDFSKMIEELLNGRASQSYYLGRELNDLKKSTSDPAMQAFLVIENLMDNSIDRLRLELFNYKRVYMGRGRIDSIGLMESIERSHMLNLNDAHAPIEQKKI